MTNIPSSGTIKFSDLKTYFGDNYPSSLSEFYKGGGIVDATVDGDVINPDVPSSGEVSLSDYYDAETYFIHTISSNVSNTDLPAVLMAAGWNGSKPVYLIVNANIYVYGTNSPGLKIENNTSNPYYITIKNNGFIVGAGGSDAGSGFTPTEGIKCSGSNAVYLTIKNTNFINGGGGAGNQITRQTNSSGRQYFGGGGGGAGGGDGDGLYYWNGGSTSTRAQQANGITGAGGQGASGYLGEAGEGSDTNSTSGNAYPFTGGWAGGGAGGGLDDGVQVGGAQGGGKGETSGVAGVYGRWGNYSGISLAEGGESWNGSSPAGDNGPITSFNQNSYSSGTFGAGAGGGWGADGGNGMQYYWNGTATSVHNTHARYDGASAIKNTSTGGSSTVVSGLGGTLYGDVT